MASTPARKTARRSRQGDESRARILAAAAEVALEFGYRGATIEKVSTRCGLPPTSLYWHFGDKDGMLAAVIRGSFDRWKSSMPTWDVEVDVDHEAELLRDRISKAIASIATEPDFWRLGMMLTLEGEQSSGAARAAFLEIRSSVLDELTGFWMRLFRSTGKSRPAMARKLARLMMATTDGLFIAAHAHDDWNLAQLAKLLVEALDGVVRKELER